MRWVSAVGLVVVVLVLPSALAGCGTSGGGLTSQPSTNNAPAAAHDVAAALAGLRDAGYTCANFKPVQGDATVASATCRSSTSQVALFVASAAHPGGATALSVDIAECTAAMGTWPAGVYMARGPAGATWTVMTGDAAVAKTVASALGMSEPLTLSCRS